MLRAEESRLVKVWAMLVVLLAATAGSAWIDLGWGNTAVNLGIAAMKSALIGWYFMHLDAARGAVRLIAGFTLGLLAVQSGLGLADLLTR